MVKNNQVQVCDDVLHMLFSTARDVDNESFHIIWKSNHHDRELAFNTDHDTAHDNTDNNHCPTYQVHQSLYYIYGVDTDCDHDHMFLQYDECVNMIFPSSHLWKQVSENDYK